MGDNVQGQLVSFLRLNYRDADGKINSGDLSQGVSAFQATYGQNVSYGNLMAMSNSVLGSGEIRQSAPQLGVFSGVSPGAANPEAQNAVMGLESIGKSSGNPYSQYNNNTYGYGLFGLLVSA